MRKGQTIGKYAVVVELGRNAPPTYAAHASTIGGDPELVVIECIRTSEAPFEANDSFVRRARRLAQARHPNIARIRDVVVTKPTIAVATDFIEGETLRELLALDAAAGSKRFGLSEQLRILVDVLSGMSAIHLAPELAGGTGKNDPVPFHGAIHPRNIVVGADGSARLIRVVRAPLASSEASVRAIDEPGYAAPELLLGDVTAGARVDIYSVGVLLWEALSGSRLFSESSAKAVVARQLAGTLPRATPPAEMEWANALVEIAARALEVDPEKRFLSTAELAGALRLAVQARLAPASRVGGAVTALAKEKIAERRARLQPKPRAAKPVVARPIANPPKITEQKAIVALPSLVEDDDADMAPVTKRLQVESLDDEDLKTGEEEIVDSKWSSVPPPKKSSVAPPLPTAKKATMTPPLPAHAESNHPPPVLLTPEPTTPAPTEAEVLPLDAQPVAHSSSNENLETIAPVVSPAPETPTFSAAAMQQSDASGAVVLQLDDPQRKRRMAIVFGMVGFAALILIAAGIRHATSGAQTTVTAAASAKTATTAPTQEVPSSSAMTTATASPTSAPVPTIATTASPPPQPASTVGASDPFDEATLQKEPTPKNNTTPTPHDWATHPTPPAKPAHKKPPHSSYEPEGI